MARLLYRDSQGRDGAVDLRPDAVCYVGRALDCAVRTDDALVSRKHSQIRMEAGRFCIEDLGSSNGTHVNEVRVTKQALNHNDVVRCGSLWLRYVEDAPQAAAAAAPAVAARPPAKKGGTQRLDPAEFGAGGALAAPPTAQPAQPIGRRTSAGFGGPVGAARPANPAPSPSRPAASEVAAAPASALFSVVANPSRNHSPTEPAPLFGGPPAMPDGIVTGDFQTPPRPVPVRATHEPSIEVDLDDDAREVERLHHELDASERAREELAATHDREIAESKRLRAEIATHKERTEELRRALIERDEVVQAHQRVADELRDELGQGKDALVAARGQTAELGELIAARDRQLHRAQDEIGKLRDEIDEKNKRLTEVSRHEDERWTKLNAQLSEIDHLREVINQQERLLEERRVGQIGQEQVIKELRVAREQGAAALAGLKAERDEQQRERLRLEARLAAIEEDSRRLGDLLAAARRGEGGGADPAGGELEQLNIEMKELRVALRTAMAERDHARQLHVRAEQEHVKIQEVLARVEVELREVEAERDRMRGGRAGVDERLTALELELRRAREELAAVREARDAAVAAAGKAAAAGPSAAALAEDDERTAIVAASDNPATLLDRAVEVHDAIDGQLRELRGKVLIVQEEFAALAKAGPADRVRTMREAIEAMVAAAEDAKGVLRGLKELIEFGHDD